MYKQNCFLAFIWKEVKVEKSTNILFWLILFLVVPAISFGFEYPKMIILGCNPADSDNFDVGRESQFISENINASKYGHNIKLETKLGATPDNLLQYSHDQEVQVIHFTGHGTELGGLVLVGKGGEKIKATQESLKYAFDGYLPKNLKLLTLSACYSADLASLLKGKASCVIGMKGSVDSKASIEFAAKLYQVLGDGCCVLDAFNQGLAIYKLYDDESDDVGPELFEREAGDAKHVFIITKTVAEQIEKSAMEKMVFHPPERKGVILAVVKKKARDNNVRMKINWGTWHPDENIDLTNKDGFILKLQHDSVKQYPLEIQVEGEILEIKQFESEEDSQEWKNAAKVNYKKVIL